MSETLLINGECVETMRGFDAGSVDAVVCDPPYHLTSIVERFGKPDAAPSKVPEGGSGVYARSSRGFMGQTWDGGDIAFRVETWREVWRVLKPGGYLLAFSGTRTYHRMAVAIEDAGFEIRDCLSWQYGSGFPKSLDVSKAIDKIDRSEAALARARAFTAWMRSTGITARQIDDATGTHMGNHYTTHPTQPCVATADLFDLLRPLLPAVPEEIEELVRSRTVESENMKRRAVVGEHKGTSPGCNMRTGMLGGDKDAVGVVTAPATDAARRWEGWGTALKPAWEPIVVARKPLEGTVAGNVLKHGTGAMNIDGCRVETTDDTSGVSGVRSVVPGDSRSSTAAGMYGEAARQVRTGGHALGRWPANVLLSCPPDCDGDTHAPGCPCAALDAQHNGASRYFNRLPIEDDDLVPFIYAAKAARSEREAGCDALPARTGAEAVEREEGSAGTKSPRAGAGRTADSVRNNHPTVKPVSVMRHLTRLVVPPGGLVLDPFMGSGTTGIAAVREGFDFVGIEMNPEYLAIAEARIEHAKAKG